MAQTKPRRNDRLPQQMLNHQRSHKARRRALSTQERILMVVRRHIYVL